MFEMLKISCLLLMLISVNLCGCKQKEEKKIICNVIEVDTLFIVKDIIPIIDTLQIYINKRAIKNDTIYLFGFINMEKPTSYFFKINKGPLISIKLIDEGVDVVKLNELPQNIKNSFSKNSFRIEALYKGHYNSNYIFDKQDQDKSYTLSCVFEVVDRDEAYTQTPSDTITLLISTNIDMKITDSIKIIGVDKKLFKSDSVYLLRNQESKLKGYLYSQEELKKIDN